MRALLYLALKHKAIAVAAAAIISTGAVATFASQDVVFQGGSVVSEEATATPVPDGEATATPVVEEPTATPEEATPTPVVDEPTPTPEATEVVEPTPTATVEGEEGPRDVVGIPDSNPVKSPEDGDGVCEKGETVIKTTPSGKQVNVPCQAAKDLGSEAGKKGAESGDDGVEDEEGTE